MKICKKCQKAFKVYCKKCHSTYYKIRYEVLYKKLIKEQRKNYPEYFILRSIKDRCYNKNCVQFKDYGGRGIKCFLSKEQIKKLWLRDKAYEMKKPSIDREDNNGNYTMNNCRFIELSENISRQDRSKISKPILQFDLEGNFIREFVSIHKAETELKMFNSHISQVANKIKKYKTAGGFIWKFKNE